MHNIFKHENGRPFEYIKEIRDADNLVIIRLRGAVDSDTIPMIEQNIAARGIKLIDKNILVDFNEVTHVDSATLAALVTNLNNAKKHHKKMGIINIHQDLAYYLDIERIKSLFNIYENEDAALKELA